MADARGVNDDVVVHGFPLPAQGIGFKISWLHFRVVVMFTFSSCFYVYSLVGE